MTLQHRPFIKLGYAFDAAEKKKKIGWLLLAVLEKVEKETDELGDSNPALTVYK